MRKNLTALLFFWVASVGLCDTAKNKVVINGFDVVASNKAQESMVVYGNGKTKKVFKKIKAFNKLSAEGAYQLEYEASNEYSVEIEAEENIIPVITMHVNGGMLAISSSRPIVIKEPIIVRLKAPWLDEVSLSGVDSAKFRRLNTKRLTINMGGTSDFYADGEVQSIHLEIQGLGNANLQKLKTDSASVKIIGSGDAALSVSKELNVSISGVGDVTYFGSPVITKEIVGLGNIRQGN